MVEFLETWRQVNRYGNVKFDLDLIGLGIMMANGVTIEPVGMSEKNPANAKSDE